jgi:hypothetical protein
MTEDLLDRILDVHGNAIWTGQFRLTFKNIKRRDYSRPINTEKRLTGHELLTVEKQKHTREFCRELISRAREKVSRDFADTPMLMAAMLHIAGIMDRPHEAD